MFKSVYDFEEFYKQPFGKMIAKILRAQMAAWMGSCKGLRVVGIGFTHPFLDIFAKDSDRCISILPSRLGAAHWLVDGQNRACIAEESELPLETNSVDRVIMVHAWEHAEILSSNLDEIWRVLKGNGRLLIITPNRMGFWSRAVWSPFGHGTPSTLDQLRSQLRDHKFVYERHSGSLYTPPLRARWVQSAARSFEVCGAFLCPALAGLHVIEVSKQLYAGSDDSGGTRVAVRQRVSLKPAPLRFKFFD